MLGQAKIKQLKSIETEDYQGRSKKEWGWPESNVADTIQVIGSKAPISIYADFKDTTEREALEWLRKKISQTIDMRGVKILESYARQTGDYQNDWVEAAITLG